MPRVQVLLPLPVKNGLVMRVEPFFLCFFVGGAWSALPLFDAQFRRQYRICCQLFAMIPSATSSIKHHSAAVLSVDFRFFFVYCIANFDRPDFRLGGFLGYISKPSVIPLSLAVSFFT